jgi:hypothetical protein
MGSRRSRGGTGISGVAQTGRCVAMSSAQPLSNHFSPSQIYRAGHPALLLIGIRQAPNVERYPRNVGAAPERPPHGMR